MTLIHIQPKKTRDYLVSMGGSISLIPQADEDFAEGAEKSQIPNLKVYNGLYDEKNHQFVSRNGLKWRI